MLLMLYQRYLRNPLEMLTPIDFKETLHLTPEELVPAVHYLSDSGLVELMIGYNPPMFAAVRITAKGIDLVEHPFEFNLRFPPAPVESADPAAVLPSLIEELLFQAELSALARDRREVVFRDIQYLREELAQPQARWREEIIQTLLKWIEAPFPDAAVELPALEKIHRVLRELPAT